ncbi:glycoside hydrolase N-terminal domain-containing protein [Maribacter sp. 4G9]|uniref:glycoside hydrolase family 95 protein n=1 Tax=Maribacter sp. 4G9 TaxID=1889777 RepID=UPI000C161109|nr:glycoside hydrolase family 95 protein [Maribacter sp. 4G9]PIB28953.1 hypothetical protein BFP75_03940 [Maribacter sp. 4G9]
MGTLKKVICTAILLAPLLFFAQHTNDLKLWYDEPSGEVWENALPIGNGRIGAMVYGNVDKDIFQLNEHTVWSGSPNRNDNPDALEALPEVRELIFKGEYKAAEQLANEKIITKKSHGQMFQPVGNLELSFPNHNTYNFYYRELDISKVISKTTYQLNGVTFTREAFVSLADRVLVIKISADEPGKVSFKANFTSPHLEPKIEPQGNDPLSLWGKTSDHEGVEGKVEFNALAKIKTSNGTATQTNSSVEVKNADSAVIMVSIATNFNSYHDLGGSQLRSA